MALCLLLSGLGPGREDLAGLSSALTVLKLRAYRRCHSNLSLLRQEPDKRHGDKHPWVELAGILFVLGTGCLALLTAGLVVFA